MKYKIFSVAVLFLLVLSCKNDDDNGMPPSASANDFVWKALNLWYYWQENSADLADYRFSSDNEYHNFINSKQTDELFFHLLYDYGNTDRFSWIVDDYHDLQNTFASINKSFGMKYGLVYINPNSNQVFGYIQYVLPNSPASISGLKRGDIFTRINGVTLTDQNYMELLGEDTATFGLGYIEDGQVLNSDTEVSITKVQLQENPVLHSEVLTIDSHKIGYLVYNGFRANFNDELNDAIGELKSQGITDLVLDLRYNGGGSVLTSAYLGSMVTGQFNQELFTQLTFNSKTSNNNRQYKFETEGKIYDNNLEETGSFPIHHLNLTKVYVLTTGNSASASEMLISCLAPYIEVITIGTKTYGKTVGSITLYDSPQDYYTSTDHLNPSHTWAMQPIVFDYKNSQSQSSPGMGIEPDHLINEIHYLENLPQLGDPEEPLLDMAISQITNSAPRFNPQTSAQARLFKTSQSFERFGTEMYLEKGVHLNP